MADLVSGSQMTDELLSLPPDPLELQIATNLILLAGDDPGVSGLTGRISALRRTLRDEIGLPLPRIRIRDNTRLEDGHYQIKLRGTLVAAGHVKLGCCLAFRPDGSPVDLEGEETYEPVAGVPARWLESDAQLKAIERGYMVITPIEQILAHLMQVVERNAARLLMREDVARMLEYMCEHGYEHTVNELTELLPLGTIHRALQRLLGEHVPIRDLPLIFEHFADAGRVTGANAPALIAEAARAHLGPLVASRHTYKSRLEVLSLDADLDRELRNAVNFDTDEPTVTLPVSRVGEIVSAVLEAVYAQRDEGRAPIVACSPLLRPALSRLLQGVSDGDIPVLSYRELDEVDFDLVGTAGAHLAVDGESESSPI